MWLVQYALRRPYSIAAMCLLILGAGLSSYARLPVDVLPAVNIPSIKVIWTYSGLNAKEMASKVTTFSEVAIMNNVDNVREVKSSTMNGASVIQINFQPQVDIANAMAQITSVSQTIIRRMPAGITPPLITQYSQSSTPILQLVMSSDTLTDAQMSDYARLQLRSMIQSINGVRMTLPYGGAMRQIMVDIDADALFAVGLSTTDVIAAINAQNLTLPSGSIREERRDLQISLNASPESLEEFRRIPLQLQDGSTIALADIATLRDGTALQTNIARVNGQNGVIVSLIKLGEASTVGIIDAVMNKLPAIRRSAPEGITIEPIFDQSVFVSNSLHHIQMEIMIVGSLVAIIVLLFLGSWRSTLIVLTAIPLSLLSALFILSLTGNTLNLMSLGGLALAIGILVDNALVEVENIERNMATGLPAQRAALLSAKQVAFPELVSTLSTCIVFSPIFMLTGVSGYIFRPIAIVVISALVTSYILSRTVVPVLAGLLLSHEGHHGPKSLLGRMHQKLSDMLDGIQRSLQLLIARLQRQNKLRAPVAYVAVLVLGMMAYSALGQNFFPKTDAGLMRFYLRAEAGTRLEETAAQFARIQHEIRDLIPQDELDFIVENIGMPDSVNLAWVDSFATGSFDGEIQIQLKRNHAPTETYLRQIREMVNEKFPSVSFFALPADTINQTLSGSTPTAFDIRFSGRDVQGNLAAAREFATRMQSVRGATDVGLQQVLNLPQYRLEIDRTRAADLGLSAQDVVSEVLGILGYAGSVNATFWSDPASGFSYAVQVQAPLTAMQSIDDLMKVTIPSPKNGESIPLGSIITVSERSAPSSIGRSMLRPTFDVLLNENGADLGTLYNHIERELGNLQGKLKPGNSAKIMGQAHSMRTAYGDLVTGLLAAVCLIYIIMLFNFASWTLPLVALVSAPIAVAGGLGGLFVTQTPITVPALMGFIMVMGVSTANSVLVTTFARDLWLTGYTANKAARIAASTRLRPVLMTATTMVLGLVPMALALGEGGEQNAPLARVVIGGLLFGTCASLVMVPWSFGMLVRHLRRPLKADTQPQLELERA